MQPADSIVGTFEGSDPASAPTAPSVDVVRRKPCAAKHQKCFSAQLWLLMRPIKLLLSARLERLTRKGHSIPIDLFGPVQ
jgi:hypothetical protein